MARGPTPGIYGYGPRPRHSQRLVALWMAAFLGILFVTWWLTSSSRSLREDPTMRHSRADGLRRGPGTGEEGETAGSE